MSRSARSLPTTPWLANSSGMRPRRTAGGWLCRAGAHKLIMLDALHPCRQTLRQAHQDNDADFLVPVKGNHPGLEARATACLPDSTPEVIPHPPRADAPPWTCRQCRALPPQAWMKTIARGTSGVPCGEWRSPAEPSRWEARTKGRPASSGSSRFAASTRIPPVAANCWNASATTGTSRAVCTSGST